MNLVRRNPSPLSAYRPGTIEDQFGRLVESMFEDFFAPAALGSAARWQSEADISPRMNVRENDQAYQVEAEMPGVKKEDIKVAIDRQRVTIEAERQHEDQQREGDKLIYAERSASRFVRSFMLPTEVDDATAQARMEDGVLCLTLPKKQDTEAKRIAIQ
ncbi:MAG: Hsp20/alpha crystallin family protein [Massilia sp.]